METGADVKIAVGLPQIGTEPQRMLDAARIAEDAGVWGVWVFDHLVPLRGSDRPVLEGWVLAVLLGRATSSVRVLSLVTRAGLRPPALVARMAAVAQAAADGRFVLGLGVGDAAGRAEERRFGVTAPATRRERIDAVGRTIDAVRAPDGGPVRPGPHPLCLWVGGTGPDVLGLAADRADAWHGWGLEPEAFAERAERVRSAAADVECWWGGMFDPGDARRVLDELRGAGADGITWMIRSARYTEWLPDLLEVARDAS